MSKETNIFEVATRNKMRFPYKGQISVEDMWDLPLTALDGIYKALNKQAKAAQEESLLETKSKEDKALEIQIAIVKHIVSVKQQEAADKIAENERKEKKQRIMALMAKKDDEAMEAMSREELQKMLDELG